MKTGSKEYYLLFGGAFFLVVESSLLLAFLKGVTDIKLTLLLHLAAILLALGLLLSKYKRGDDILRPVFLAVMLAGCGVFGALIAVVIGLYSLFSRKRSENFMEWYEAIFPVEVADKSRRLYERITFGLEEIDDESGNIEPYINILKYGSLRQKQEVLSKIGRYFRPEFSLCLREALSSRDNSVRVLAAAIIARVDNEYSGRCIELEKKISAMEDFAATKELANIYEEFAGLGIVDPDREKQLFAKAIALYEKLWSQERSNSSYRIKIAELLMKTGQEKKSALILEEMISGNIYSLSGNSLEIYFESLFRMGEFAKLRQSYSDISKILREQEGDYLPGYLDLWGKKQC